MPADIDYDLLVMGGMVADGTGLPARRADVGVRDGRIAAVGLLDPARARRVLDAAGLVVAPGIVDAHTHYDPQVTFDPYAQVSPFHGVTTVLAGNCGFSIAPCRSADRPFLTGIFSRIEGMDPSALAGIRWDFETFDEYVGSLRGRLGINVTSYVGHSNLRRWAMGPAASDRPATVDERIQMCALLRAAMAAGAAGFSSSSAPTHLDGDERPIPSRLADDDELVELAGGLAETGRGSITYLPKSAIGGLDDHDKDLLIRLAATSGRPVITQGLGGRNKVDAPTATWDEAVSFLNRAAAQGAPVYSILNVRPFDRLFHLDPPNQHYLAVASWNALVRASRDDQIVALADPAHRAEFREAVEHYNRDATRGTTLPPPRWRDVYVHQVSTEDLRSSVGQSVEALAAQRGVAPADAMLDIALADGLTTEFRWSTASPEWHTAVRDAQRDPRMIVGTSDGGAHLARDDGADWSSYFLRHWVLDEGEWSLEEGIRRISHLPASLLGLPDRGLVRTGYWADLMVFDPATIRPGRKEFTRDLPGGAGRYKAWAEGVTATIVNGVPIIEHEQITGALPGQYVSPA